VQHADTVQAIETTNRLARATEDYATASRRLADAAEVSAKAAKEQADVARTTLAGLERPYIFFDLQDQNNIGRKLDPWVYRLTNKGIARAQANCLLLKCDRFLDRPRQDFAKTKQTVWKHCLRRCRLNQSAARC
jgi:hypothetical protein